MSHKPSRCLCSGCGGGRDADWPYTTGPALVLFARRGLEPGPFRPARWVDHAYVIRLPGGRRLFVAEPYSLSERAFEDFRALTASGWDVSVSAELARHYPGRTVAVLICRR